jgi:hypothetical protein
MPAVASSFIPVNEEAIQFNRPVSESSLSAIAGLANGLLSIALPIGSIVDSTLTEVQFQAQIGNPSPVTWVLADGRDITGTSLQLLTGQLNAPDLRGIFTRGKNNGRADGNQNPDGDLAIGTYTADKFLSHTHSYREPGGGGVSGEPGSQGLIGATTGGAGGNETAPKTITVNKFIRIN